MNGTPQQVLITRTADPSDSVHSLFAEQGYLPVGMPLFTMHENKQGKIEIANFWQNHQFDWIIITSPKVAKIFIETLKTLKTLKQIDCGAPTRILRPRFALVGPKIKTILEQHFQPFQSLLQHSKNIKQSRASSTAYQYFLPNKKAHNSDSLYCSQSLSASLAPILQPKEKIWWLSPEHTNFDWQAHLKQKKVFVHQTKVYYKTVLQKNVKKIYTELSVISWIIFSSPSVVRLFYQNLPDQSTISQKKIAALGSSTKRELEKNGQKVCVSLSQPSFINLVDAMKKYDQTSTK